MTFTQSLFSSSTCVCVGARGSLTNEMLLRVYLVVVVVVGGEQMMKLCSSAPEDRLHDDVPDRSED